MQSMYSYLRIPLRVLVDNKSRIFLGCWGLNKWATRNTARAIIIRITVNLKTSHLSYGHSLQ